jgi:K+-transporting ATPase ATPase A chain
MFVGVVGSGMSSMLLKILLAVFVAGLMIGRTPAFLGKRIDGHGVKLVSGGLLAVPVLVLAATALSIGRLRGAHRSSTRRPTLWGVAVVIAGLSIFPALAPGPIVEGLGH